MTSEHTQEISLAQAAFVAPEAFNPADVVSKALMFNSHPDPFRWLQGIDPNAIGDNVDIRLKRFLVNRQLRMILGMAHKPPEIDTNVARYCLVDEGRDDQWTMLINENIAPLMAKHNLPQPRN